MSGSPQSQYNRLRCLVSSLEYMYIYICMSDKGRYNRKDKRERVCKGKNKIQRMLATATTTNKIYMCWT